MKTSSVKTPAKKRPSVAWKDKYKAPNTKGNTTRLWVLPSFAEIVDDLRACNGQVDVFVYSLSKNPKRRELLLMQISELRANELVFGQDVWLDVIAAGVDARQTLSEYEQ